MTTLLGLGTIQMPNKKKILAWLDLATDGVAILMFVTLAVSILAIGFVLGLAPIKAVPAGIGSVLLFMLGSLIFQGVVLGGLCLAYHYIDKGFPWTSSTPSARS